MISKNIFKFEITDAAALAFKEALQKRGTPNSYIRIGVLGGGCSGYKYYIDYEDNEIKKNDLFFKHLEISILIDKKSIKYLNNAQIDWKKETFKKGFIINNPQVKKTCGCQKSFEI